MKSELNNNNNRIDRETILFIIYYSIFDGVNTPYLYRRMAFTVFLNDFLFCCVEWLVECDKTTLDSTLE